MKKDMKAISMAASKEPVAQKYSIFSLVVIAIDFIFLKFERWK